MPDPQFLQQLMQIIQPAISHQQQPIFRRSDGSIKSSGWLGPMVQKETEVPEPGEDMLTRTGAIPYSQVSSEISVGPGIGYPTMVPGLTNDQVRYLQALKYGQPIRKDILDKAREFKLHQERTGQPIFQNDKQLEFDPGMNPILDRMIRTLKDKQ